MPTPPPAASSALPDYATSIDQFIGARLPRWLTHAAPAPLAELIASRFIDTLLGCVVGLVGGICLHSARCRAVVGEPLRRLMPRRPQS